MPKTTVHAICIAGYPFCRASRVVSHDTHDTNYTACHYNLSSLLMAESSSSSSATSDGFTYDVFLSFRGLDTRHDFTGSLGKALEDKGIRTFFDKEDIPKGKEITPSLLQSIEQSRMALVVLSPNYASSAFCLDELSHILNHIKGKGRLVWPIFYEVEPSDVRWLNGTFGEAMAEHGASSWYNTDRLQKWRNGLHQVANFSGTYFQNVDKYQYEFIEQIVKEVSREINEIKKDVKSLLNVGSDNEVNMVGIDGIGGIVIAGEAMAMHEARYNDNYYYLLLSGVTRKLLNVLFLLLDLPEILMSSSSVSGMETKWRIVGLVSSVVGLLCFALSPSFNREFGGWNSLKFILYGVLSLVICTTILFAKKSLLSTQFVQLRSYISFAVLMIISVYSFYYDKAVNGKPETLSLVSNAAFALVSLSLSKLVQLGFEMGMFSYFLGCLAVQLWTIHWWLILVAIIFGCPLFRMHSPSDSGLPL